MGHERRIMEHFPTYKQIYKYTDIEISKPYFIFVAEIDSHIVRAENFVSCGEILDMEIF